MMMMIIELTSFCEDHLDWLAEFYWKFFSVCFVMELVDGYVNHHHHCFIFFSFPVVMTATKQKNDASNEWLGWREKNTSQWMNDDDEDDMEQKFYLFFLFIIIVTILGSKNREMRIRKQSFYWCKIYARKISWHFSTTTIINSTVIVYVWKSSKLTYQKLIDEKKIFHSIELNWI